MTDLERVLKAELRRALASGDRHAATAQRTAVAAIDNAGSVGQPHGESLPAFGGTREVPRQERTGEEAAGILRREIDELGEGIAASERHGAPERAGELQARRAVLVVYVGA